MLRISSVGLTLALALTVAGCAPRSGTTSPPQTGQPADGRELPLVGVVLREFEFEPRPLRARSGKVRFLLMNRGTVEHDFFIPALREHGDHERHLVLPGKTLIVEIDLKPGSYTLECSIPGHKDAGMVATIEVS
ncbi:MAG: plastocyanin/azurin family copper-binding protein [Acidimicrobiia bacterium]